MIRVAAQSKGSCIGGDAGNRAVAVLHDHGRMRRRCRSESLNENFDRCIGQFRDEIGPHGAPPTGRTCRIEEGLELHVGHRLQLIGNDRPPFPQRCDCRFRTVSRPNVASRDRDDWPIAVADETGISRQRIGSGAGKIAEMA